MIQNQWYGILDSREVLRGRPVGVTRLGLKLVLWRDPSGQVHCIADRCCHRGASLSAGKVVQERIQCPFHGFEYDQSGRVVRIPANGLNAAVPPHYHVQAFQVRDEAGFIWLWTGAHEDPAPPVPFFEELRSGFSYGGFSEVWPVHYTRAIENQLDVVHLPFVHTNSIGRGHRTLVNGPVVEWENDRMTFYVDNQPDDGRTRPLKADEMKDYQRLFHLQFQMPNLWQNVIGQGVRIVAVFAPVDESHTRIYLRFYQSFMRIPVIRHLVHFPANTMNRYILHQDRRVVLTQIPKKSELPMDEKLIQGDAPIIAFRKRRAALLKQNPPTN